MAGTTLEEVLQAEKAAELAEKTALRAILKARDDGDGDKDARRKAMAEYLKLFRRQRELEQQYFAEHQRGTRGV